MRAISALLLALAASAIPDGADADFAVSSATTSQSGSDYVRQWTLTASGSSARYVEQIKIEMPGQVFISYLSGQASGVAGYVNVTSSSSAVVDAVQVRSDDSDSDDDSDDDDGDELHIKCSAGSTSMVTEIFLTQQSSIEELKSQSSADIVVEADVIATSGTDDELKFELEGSGSVYVSDPSAEISMKQFDAKVSGSGSLQIEVSSMAFTEDAEFETDGSGGITLLASSFSCDELKFQADGSGTICVSAETVSATESEAEDASKVSLPNSSSKYSTTGSFSCTEASVPTRGNNSTASSSSATSGTTTTTTTTGSGSGSDSTTDTVGSSSSGTATPTPTPTNGVSTLTIAAVGQLAVLAVALAL